MTLKAKWLKIILWICFLCFLRVSEKIYNFIVQFQYLEQHAGLKKSIVARNNVDGIKIYKYFLQNSLFPENPDLYTINIDVFVNRKIICHNSRELGIKDRNGVVSGDFGA